MSRPSRAYSVESPVRPYTRQASPILSLSNPGDHFNSTSRSLSPASTHIYVLMTSPFAQLDSVNIIQDALGHISQPQPVQVGQSNLSGTSQQVHIEHLPPVLVLHLKRFLYDVVTDGTTKINKHVQFPPELEIPLGTNSSSLLPMAAKINNPSWLDWYRNYGTRFREFCEAGTLQTSWSALPPWRVCGQQTLFSRRAPIERRQRWWGSLVTY